MIRAGQVYLKLAYEDRDTARRIEGCEWHPGLKMWSWPCSRWRILVRLFPGYAKIVTREIEDLRYQIARRKVDTMARAAQVNNTDLSDYNFKLKPYDHQLKMVRWGIVKKMYAFFCEMGTGKTKAIIDIFGILFFRHLVRNCLIVCPKSVLDVWVDEFAKNMDRSDAVILYGTQKKRKKLLAEGHTVNIINYAGLLSIKKDPLLKNFDMVVLDESSRIKNPQSQRTKAVLDLFKHVKYKYICSGTPITQSPIDIFPQYKFLNEEFIPQRSYYTFRNLYCKVDSSQGYPKITGYKNLPQLKAIIKAHSIQIKKEDCLDLPEKIFTKRILDMSPLMMEQYEQMREDLILELAEEENVTAPIVIVKILRLQQILAGSYLENKDNEKMKEVKEIVEQTLGEGKQVIIWCRFKKSMERLVQLMGSMAISYSCLHGGTEDRGDQIRRFQAGETKVFLGQIEAGGIGITLTAGSVVVYYENTFSLEDRKQSEDRCHRIGQKEKVLYIDLVYRDTVDAQILKAIHDKQKMSTFLVDSFLKGDYRLKDKKI